MVRHFYDRHDDRNMFIVQPTGQEWLRPDWFWAENFINVDTALVTSLDKKNKLISLASKAFKYKSSNGLCQREKKERKKEESK